MNRPLVAATRARRFVNAKIRRWTAYASRVSPGTSTPLNCSSAASMCGLSAGAASDRDAGGPEFNPVLAPAFETASGEPPASGLSSVVTIVASNFACVSTRRATYYQNDPSVTISQWPSSAEHIAGVR